MNKITKQIKILPCSFVSIIHLLKKLSPIWVKLKTKPKNYLILLYLVHATYANDNKIFYIP